jgi:hypothetical protein
VSFLCNYSVPHMGVDPIGGLDLSSPERSSNVIGRNSLTCGLPATTSHRSVFSRTPMRHSERVKIQVDVTDARNARCTRPKTPDRRSCSSQPNGLDSVTDLAQLHTASCHRLAGTWRKSDPPPCEASCCRSSRRSGASSPAHCSPGSCCRLTSSDLPAQCGPPNACLIRPHDITISRREEITWATRTINVRYGSRITKGGLRARLVNCAWSLRALITNRKRVLRANLCDH